jgi:hypothetical protein
MDLKSRHFKSIDFKSKSKYPNATYGYFYMTDELENYSSSNKNHYQFLKQCLLNDKLCVAHVMRINDDEID